MICGAGLWGADLAVAIKEESVTAGTAWRVDDYYSANATLPPQLDRQQVGVRFMFNVVMM
jgi:hypothetical protein